MSVTDPQSPPQPQLGKYWIEIRDGHPEACAMYRRHYSSQKNRMPRKRLFVGPGEKLVLLGNLCSAVFAWQYLKFRSDVERGINCAVFRNESNHRSSDMVREAVDWAFLRWPCSRLFTFIDTEATARRRSKRALAGHCFRMAGWRECRITKGGLLVLEYP